MEERTTLPTTDGHLLADALPVLPDTPASHSSAQARGSGWLFPLFAAVAGGLDGVLLLGWHQIDPTNLAWIRKDPAVYQAGWEFLRRQPWTFPPTWLAHLDYPFGISAAYLDVIPIVAVPLHLFGGILPQNFQYLGLWAVLCLVLQTYFALKLLSRFTSDRIVLCLGALFFLDAPILLNRLYGHFSLCSQWLILAALYYYFRPTERIGIARYMAPFTILSAIAGGITPYIAVMIVLIGFAALLKTILEKHSCLAEPGNEPVSGREMLWQSRVVWCVAPAASAAFAFFVFGFITPGSGPGMSGAGYGSFSMNLLAPIDPGGTSMFIKPLTVLPDQRFEGYSYLGLGILLLGLGCLVRRPRLLHEMAAPCVRPLLYVSVLLTILALSIRIVAGQTLLLTIPTTPQAFHLLAIFRSSGRFFWPVYYLLMLGAVVGCMSVFARRWASQALLAAACLLQHVDTLPLRDGVAQQSAVAVQDPLAGSEWGSLERSAKHLVVLPAWQCGSGDNSNLQAAWPWFARLAAREGLTLNSVHAARLSAASDNFNCAVLPGRVAQGALDRNSAYVLDDRLALLTLAHNKTHVCRRVGGFNLCTFDPKHAALSHKLAGVILPSYTLGTAFEAGRPPPRSMLMVGWDLRPAPAVWTVGRQSYLYLRPKLPVSGDLRLEFDFGGNGALLTRHHPMQHAIVSVDGNRAGDLTFRLGGDNRRRSVIVPQKIAASNGIVVIGLLLPDAVAPSTLGINRDDRKLGLYVARIRLVRNQ